MDGWLNVVQDWPVLCIVFSSLTFRLLHTLLKNLPKPQIITTDPWKKWKCENLSVSLVHSLLTGTWAIFSVLQDPVLVFELSSYFTPYTHLLVIVSTGYFIQDAGDIIFSGHSKESWEFLLHHVVVIWTFLYAVFTWQYIGGAVVALFVEVNSIFLHSRLILKMARMTNEPIYTINKFLNLITYVSFRLGAQAYLTWYILANYSSLDYALYFLLSMILMNIMILIYFYRLVRADFFTKHSHRNGVRKFVQD